MLQCIALGWYELVRPQHGAYLHRAWRLCLAGCAQLVHPPAAAGVQGKQLVFVTNNSTKSRAGYLNKFTSLGLNVAAVRCLLFCCALAMPAMPAASGCCGAALHCAAAFGLLHRCG